MKIQTLLTAVVFIVITSKGNCLYNPPPIENLVKDSELIVVTEIIKGLSDNEIFQIYRLNSEFDYCALGKVIEVLKGKPSGEFIIINYKWRAQKPNISCLEQGKKYVLCLKGEKTTFQLYFPHEGASVYGSWNSNNVYKGRDIKELRIEINRIGMLLLPQDAK